MIDLFAINHYKISEGFLWVSTVAWHRIEVNNINLSNWYREHDLKAQS